MSTPARGIEAPIALPLVAAIVSWGLFLSAQYSDLLLSVQGSNEYDPSAPEVVRPSVWLTLAAVAVFGITALVAQRRAIAARAALGPDHELARAAHRFTTLAVILALAGTTIVGIGTFFSGFIMRTGGEVDPVVRIANAYAPIVVATALLVVLLLGAFVFRRAAVPASPADGDDAADARAEHPLSALAARLGGRAALGLAYATPIVLGALGFIIGLIVFDVTGTAPEAWVWVIIQALIGAGIVAGTVLARAARDAAEAAPALSPAADGPALSPGAVRGARALALVLSIVFGVVVTSMSLAYGATAISRLSVAPSLYVEAYPTAQDARDGLMVSANGYGLDTGSAVVVTLEPGGETLIEGRVDQSTSFYDDHELDGPLEPGEYTLTATGTTGDDRPIEMTSTFTIDEQGLYELDVKPTPSDSGPRLVDPGAEWLLEDFLPALVLIVLACAVIQATIVARNRR